MLFKEALTYQSLLKREPRDAEKSSRTLMSIYGDSVLIFFVCQTH